MYRLLKVTLFTVGLLVVVFACNAQLSIGLEGGINNNHLVTTNISQSFTDFKDEVGFTVGIPLKYKIKDWISLQTDPNFTQKNFSVERTGYFDGVYQKNTNSYVQVPVYASLSVGNEKLRAFGNLGLYGGYWISSSLKGVQPNILNTTDTGTISPINIFAENHPDNYHVKRSFSNLDNRFEFGWLVGAGASYQLNNKYQLLAECRFTSAFSSQLQNNQINQIPRYNETLAIIVGVLFNLSAKHH